MTDYAWPAAIIPNAADMRYISNTGASVSPLTGAVRTVGRGGDHWGCSLTINTLRGDQRAALRAFLARLRGRTHRAVFGDFSHQRRGALTSNLLANAASAESSTLSGTSTQPSLMRALAAGDYLTLDGYLYMATADADTNSGGSITIEVAPPLHRTSTYGAAIEVLSPTARFMLTGNTVGWSSVPSRPTPSSAFSLDWEEDVGYG